MTFIASRLLQQEVKYQFSKKEALKQEIDYALTKWEISPDEHTSKAIRIISDYKIIVSQITNHENR